MNLHHLCRSLHVFIVLCGRWADAATEAGAASEPPLTFNPITTNGGPFSPTTPEPGRGPGATSEKQEAFDSTSVGTAKVFTAYPDSMALGTTGLDTTAPDSTGPGTTAPGTTGLDSTGPGTTAPGTTEPGTTGLDSTEPGTTGPGSTGPGTTEPGTTGPSITPTLSESPSATTTMPVVIPEACLCDLTPGFCDIGCCCDTADCGVADLRTVFTCPEKPVSGVCIEKSLMFKANVDPSLVTVTDSLLCVRPKYNATASRRFPALPRYPALGDSYHFSPPGSTTARLPARDFYRADDVILTYFSKSSVRGVLRQPSPGAATASCVNRNPAKFLRSRSRSCTRTLTLQSCTTDPNLSARSYFSGLNLVKIPVMETTQKTDLLIPVTPLADWPAPSRLNNSCVNVVSKVEFVIVYTGRGELTNATVNVVLTDVDANEPLLQKHSVEFQLATPSPPRGPTPAVGLQVGSPVIGLFNEAVKPVTVLEALPGGECSSTPSTRAPILFTHNTITGCMFRSSSSNCSELSSQVYGVLQGPASPDGLAMNSGSQPDWTGVVTRRCSVDPQQACKSGCILPHHLSVQVLWARQGLLHLPQNYILGARYLFHCHQVKCPVSSTLALTTEVTFVDVTVYPEPPRGSPRPDWKFPFGFFTRAAAELDGQTVSNCGDIGAVAWRATLLMVMMLTGLEFFSR